MTDETDNRASNAAALKAALSIQAGRGEQILSSLLFTESLSFPPPPRAAGKRHQ
ncbi:hypothetical protein Y017_13200 [Alcanivorax sp. 97CO-5]|nr:hypothetical protein Y017_13200 [Alcanivorax sp. 97CO-5]